VLTLLVPLGGRGQKFAERGYTFPKPLVEIQGRPMIDCVVESLKLGLEHRFVFVCRDQHLRRYALGDVLNLVAPGCRVVPMRGDTAGALCTVLLAIEWIDPEGELIVVNGDQLLGFTLDDFVQRARQRGVDGSLVTFTSTHPKWSYALTDEEGWVRMVAEKRPISRHATVGVYYFRRGRDFLAAATRMLLKGSRTAGEFFLSPVYNEMILEGLKVDIYRVRNSQVISLATPEDLEKHLATLPSCEEDPDW
jgi:NDP-sugar pyrophosphorylase family protein